MVPKRYTYWNRKDRTITTIFIGATIPFGKVIEWAKANMLYLVKVNRNTYLIIL